mmetsp:Transcript_56847/g.94298  ORF Transcript_56847/g.94298 Transcript_56847/m.94298 type:complete len:215 (+) Transcript_56847:2489-3133(+)
MSPFGAVPNPSKSILTVSSPSRRVRRVLGGSVRGLRCRTWAACSSGVRSLPCPCKRIMSSPFCWKPRTVKRCASVRWAGRSSDAISLADCPIADATSSFMFSSNWSTASGLSTRVSQRFNPIRTSAPTFSLPPAFTNAFTFSTVLGSMASSIMMAIPRRSLYSENGVTARSRGNTSLATSFAWLILRGSMLYSFAIRKSDPSVPPAQSEFHGVI